MFLIYSYNNSAAICSSDKILLGKVDKQFHFGVLAFSIAMTSTIEKGKSDLNGGATWKEFLVGIRQLLDFASCNLIVRWEITVSYVVNSDRKGAVTGMGKAVRIR